MSRYLKRLACDIHPDPLKVKAEQMKPTAEAIPEKNPHFEIRPIEKYCFCQKSHLKKQSFNIKKWV